MLVVGEERRIKGNYYIWHACTDCGTERWVQLGKLKSSRQPRNTRCRSCAGKVFSLKMRGVCASNWRGGRIKNDGYVLIHSPNHPHADRQGYVREHRLIMEEMIGRYLTPQEYVHHINGIPDDNHKENLELISPTNHSLYKRMCSHCALRKEIRLLKWQIKELFDALQGKQAWPRKDENTIHGIIGDG